MPVVGRFERLVAYTCTGDRCVYHRRRHHCRDRKRQMARPLWGGTASAYAMVAGARVVPDPVGGRDRKIRVAVAAVLSAATGDHRSIYRRSAKTAGYGFFLRQTSARRFP